MTLPDQDKIPLTRFRPKLVNDPSEIGLRKIKHMRDNEVPFVAMDYDALYGRNGWFRDQLAQE